jgi:GH15 family glucan-1,4-alpha-glucosidase
VASPTTSLPEQVGGSRNWDYRFCLPRDASNGISDIHAHHHQEEDGAFLACLLHATPHDRPRLRALLTLHGRRAPTEQIAREWPGYHDSRPVRFGNGAADQHQLDGYGWVVDAAWQYTRRNWRLNGETWRAVRAFANHVASCWQEPDAGIWEERTEPSHHVHSKLMAWLALDRATRIAEREGRDHVHARRWAVERDRIGEQIREQGYDPARGVYTRRYRSQDLDAAVLVLPLVGLEPPDSPRVRSTIDAIRRELDAGEGLLYRYTPGADGIDEPEGAFLPCSFWLVQALAASGRVGEAKALFADLRGRIGPLGLLPEEIDPVTGAFAGNFPQALSHAALLQAALALDRPLDEPDAHTLAGWAQRRPTKNARA